MSFYKGIAQAVKKNVSFKNLVKIGTMASAYIPMVGPSVQGVMSGMSAAHESKKQGKKAQAQAQIEQASQIASQAIVSNGAQFLNKTAKKVYDSAPQAIQEGAGQVGASVIDSSIKEWFKEHWKLLVGITVGIIGLIFIVPMLKGSNRRPALKTRYR